MQNLHVKHLNQTFATQVLDNTIFTKPGPATEVDSITSQAGRFLAMACEKFSMHEKRKVNKQGKNGSSSYERMLLLHEILK
jgi:hypothetical protein